MPHLIQVQTMPVSPDYEGRTNPLDIVALEVTSPENNHPDGAQVLSVDGFQPLQPQTTPSPSESPKTYFDLINRDTIHDKAFAIENRFGSNTEAYFGIVIGQRRIYRQYTQTEWQQMMQTPDPHGEFDNGQQWQPYYVVREVSPEKTERFTTPDQANKATEAFAKRNHIWGEEADVPPAVMEIHYGPALFASVKTKDLQANQPVPLYVNSPGQKAQAFAV